MSHGPTCWVHKPPTHLTYIYSGHNHCSAGNIQRFRGVALNQTTGKQRRHVINLITIISNHLFVCAVRVSISHSKPSGFHLKNACGRNKQRSARFYSAERRKKRKSAWLFGYYASFVSAAQTWRELVVTCSSCLYVNHAFRHLLHLSLTEYPGNHCMLWRHLKPNEGDR